MVENPDLPRLLLHRNRLVWAAVILLGGATAAALPQVLSRRAELKSTNAELLRLQAKIRDVQQYTRYVQRDILQAQSEIQALAQPH